MDDQKRSQILDNYPGSDTTNSLPLGKNEEKTSTTRKEQAQPGKAVRQGVVSPKHTKKGNPTQLELVHQAAQQSKKQPKHKRIKTVTISTFFLILIGTILFTGWYIFLATQHVTVFQVGRQQSVSEYIGGGGIVAPKQQLNLSFPVAERAVTVLVKAGDSVKQNQPLIKLDPSQLNAQVQQASADVDAARAYYNSVANSALNPITVAAAQQQLNQAENRYRALLAQTSNPTLRNGNLIAPTEGVVTAVNINSGEVFNANQVLLTLMDQSAVIVQTKIPLANLRQIALGMPAVVSPSALPDVNLKGTVLSIIPQADPQTDTFGVWVEVDNPQHAILPGMSAFVRIQGQQTALVVPRISVLNPDRESSVFIVRNGHAYLQQVHVVGSTPDTFLIDSGLAPNDQIIMLPLNRIHDGQSISITKIER